MKTAPSFVTLSGRAPKSPIDMAHELIDTLCILTDRTARILDLATAQLQSALELETDLGLIVDDYDH